MKDIKILALAAFSILIFSCNDNDDETVIQQTGKWRLINVSGGLLGVNQNYEGETITWEFNTNKTVTIVNSNTNDDGFDGPDSGNYTFGFVNSESPEICTETLYVNNADYGCVTQTQTNLVLDANYADGFKYTFEFMPPLQTN